MLEEIGAINRRNLYKLSDLTENGGDMVIITLEDGEELQLTSEEWNEVLQTGMQACGYLEGEKIVSVVNGCAVGA